MNEPIWQTQEVIRRLKEDEGWEWEGSAGQLLSVMWQRIKGRHRCCFRGEHEEQAAGKGCVGRQWRGVKMCCLFTNKNRAWKEMSKTFRFSWRSWYVEEWSR
ncbi:hypothetical protein [Dictyobacter formicarum]|uniref:Uncharacterized protein n=1 Tax=Dictyobacter formicarum TaxID=2778368 RepID=A0ABQ3V9F8_9CHLR|nr:hypothetical protein [Dictyobacter formicarum]GHO82619.1 hypothetical protein KSZ_06250 [Dictyobacter formicarum]